MNELYLVYPQINPKSYSGDVIQRPSRFLDDCPGELIEEWRVGGGW
jgi:DNA helicase-2/ATP-dependent DNA helicase PcrA